MVNASMMKPCGLLSLRVAFRSLHVVTRLLTVRLLSPDNQLPGIGVHPVRVLVEVALHAVYLHRLVDVARNHPVVVPFFRQVLVIIVCALVGEEQRTPDIAFDGVLVGREREESSWKRFTCDFASIGLFCAISCERASIRLLPLSRTYIFCRCFGEAVRVPQANPVTSAHRQMNTSAKSRICRKLVSMFVNDLNSMF